MVAVHGGGQVIIVTESEARNKPQLAFTVAEILYLPGLLKICLGFVSAEILALPLAGSPKFQATALIAKSDFKPKTLPFARHESVKRIVAAQGMLQGTITLVKVFEKMPQLELMVALIV